MPGRKLIETVIRRDYVGRGAENGGTPPPTMNAENEDRFLSAPTQSARSCTDVFIKDKLRSVHYTVNHYLQQWCQEMLTLCHLPNAQCLWGKPEVLLSAESQNGPLPRESVPFYARSAAPESFAP